MSFITIVKMINASTDEVFDTIADIRQYSQAIPHIVNVEFVTSQQSGIGTRFKETRIMAGKEATTELEVTEYQPPERVRMIADSGGTVWDTVFTILQTREGCQLNMNMDARAHKWLPKLINPLIKGMVAKAVEKDMEMVKIFCEQKREG